MKADHAQNISSRKPLVIYTQCHALYTTIGYDQDSATKTDVFSRWSYTFEVTFDIYKKQAYRLIMARPNDLGFGPTTDLATKQDALSTNPHCSSKGQGPEAATPSCWKERIDTRRNSNWPPPCCVKTVGFFITIQPLGDTENLRSNPHRCVKLPGAMINCIISTISKDRVNDRTDPTTWADLGGGRSARGWIFLWFDQCDVVNISENAVELPLSCHSLISWSVSFHPKQTWLQKSCQMGSKA